jgi:uracil-DNA glycosylase family 4
MVRGEGKLDGLGLVIMGEAPAREEVRQSRPFVGETGQKVLDPLLEQHLPQNGCPISREGVYITNALLCPLNKSTVTPKQIEAAIACCNQRRVEERELVGAKFIIGMGATAAQALIGEKTVKTYRGAIMDSPFGLCSITYHPTFILRGKKTGSRVQSDVYYQVIFQDLVNAYRMVDPTVPADERMFRPAYDIAPPMEDVLGFLDWIRANKKLCCVDIECDSIDPLAANLTIIGFGAEVDGVVVSHAVPVWEGSGYTTAELEEFYATFAALEADPAVPKLFHNFTYDVTVLERHGMPTRGKVEDTLILHYCLFPELMHDLQSVATSYLNIGPWKVNFRRRESARRKKYEALAQWQEKAEEASVTFMEFRKHIKVVEPPGKKPLVGKKLAAAFTGLGLDEIALARFKKARTARKRADKKLVQLEEEINKEFYDEEGRDINSIEELHYNALDVACTLGSWLAMQEVEREDLDKITGETTLKEPKLYETDVAVADIARQMQLRGLPVIGDARTTMQTSLRKQVAEHEVAIQGFLCDVLAAAQQANPEWFDGRFADPKALEAEIKAVRAAEEAASQQRRADKGGSTVVKAVDSRVEGNATGPLPILSFEAAQWDELSMRDRSCVQLAAICAAGVVDPKKAFKIMSPEHKSFLLDAYEVPVDELTAKTGQRKMDKDNLVKYRGAYDVVRSMLDYSTAHKLLRTFVEGKKIIIGEDGRIHPSWNSKGSTNPEEYGTVTGRWASTPNVQNWPYEMRAMIGFRDDEDWTLVGADFSQLEFRILAWFAGQTDLVIAFNEGPILTLDGANPEHNKLLKARNEEKKNLKECPEGLDVDGLKLGEFKNLIPDSHRDLWMQRILRVEKNAKGEIFVERDIHSATAVSIFGNEYIDAPLKKYKLLRNLTKRATYGGMYGGNADTLYSALHRDFPGTSKTQCELFLEKFDRIWPDIVSWRKDSHDRATKDGELRTPLLGRCRLFPLHRPEATVAFNWPIQATAGDIMNTSLRRLYNYVQSRDDLRGRAYPIIQVHDAIYWEVRQEIAEEFRAVVEEQMSCYLEHETVWMNFPVEAKIGKIWSET